jgi:hypothetical protein
MIWISGTYESVSITLLLNNNGNHMAEIPHTEYCITNT